MPNPQPKRSDPGTEARALALVKTTGLAYQSDLTKGSFVYGVKGCL